MKKLGLIMAGFAIIAIAACSSTKVTSSWRADDAQQLQKGNKIMVMALVPQKDRTLRSQMENYTVAELQKKGYNAVSALQTYGPKEMGKMNEKQALKQLRGSDVNQVMTIVMLDKGRERISFRATGPTATDSGLITLCGTPGCILRDITLTTPNTNGKVTCMT